MLNVLRESLRTKRRTTGYPDVPDLAPPAYRGRPVIDPMICECAGECVAACPSGAITLAEIAPETMRWQLDLARCVFCGLCAEACPHDAITLTNEYELAARSRADLITGVTYGPDAPVDAIPTSDDERLRGRIQGLLKRSLHIRHCDTGSENSCDWEINALLNPVYDVQRLGIDFVASPRHADLLLATGAVTRHLEPALRATYEAMPEPRLVVAVGDEACSGGILRGSYAVRGGVDQCVPVDVYVPGDPPRPQALIQGLLIAMDRLEPKVRHREQYVGRAPA
jgi:Ni,Fe-hydrogenase III small subunit/formate hydrogenlyase subunit 6/NADH:ubiquinone oxidoreductase subunit I